MADPPYSRGVFGRGLPIVLGVVVGMLATVRADSVLTDDNPLQMPEVGSHGLRVLSPALLELTLINTKDPDPARVTSWNFVGDDFQLHAPSASQFAVVAGGQSLAVQAVGFKRRPLYAPLKKRDLRVANYLYLRLAAPIADGQTVEVQNPNGQLWSSGTQFTAIAEPFRWSPALHVNQVGYLPSFPKKAMVGYYLGSLGEMAVPAQAGFQVIDASGQAVYFGQLVARRDQGYNYSPTPYQQVWEADFSSLTTPGQYRLFVPGLGTSFPFLIDEGVGAAFARTFALGIFHQRCGMKEDLPFTRHVHDVCHAAPAQVPNISFTAVNNELANMTGDSANYQTAPALKDVNSSLYPFVNLANRDVSGGHHDAGDYSKYTINSAGFIHFLVFAADAFPGVSDLDNLGLPESGDGKSDILQEAKWEADFLAKMQDTDGGFYFLVYPRDREYEDDVLPDKGDPQVVFPKTTSVTAAAVAALAEAGSSPTFRRQFPTEAALYLQKAKLGWAFLQKAIAKYGKAGAYQKITHYGNEFTHDDELAWAACALFVATGDQTYHQQLRAWFDPSDPNTRRWTWWRLFEGYGCAVRTYAFAARSGRLPASALDPAYLAKCESEIRAAADDQVRFAQKSAYGTSFPDPNKAYRTAGWYFSSERAFDVTVAYQLDPRSEYQAAVVSNFNFEAGCNPLNLAYVTGLGWHRQREIVHQYAENDRRVLPPSGLPLGNVQASFQYLDNYQGDLEGLSFPADAATTAPYPYYDRWGDSFNTTTEFVIMDQARSLASLSFWMAQTSIRTQPWRAAVGQITGLPASVPAKQAVTASLVVPGLDLSQARLVWEGRDQEPQFGNPATFAAKSAGDQWVEVEAQLPDGRRVFVATNFLATTALDTPPNSYQSAPLTITPDMVALFHLDTDLSDATGKHGSLTLAGNARLDTSNLGWLSNRQGAALECTDLGDKATITIPGTELRSGSDTTAILIEAMVYVDAFVAYNRDLASIVSLYQSWDAFLQLGEDIYMGPYVRGGTQMEMIGSALTGLLTPKQWHHLSLEVNQSGYLVRIDGQLVKSSSSSQLSNWGRATPVKVELGNFAGWIDEVVVRSVRSGAPPNHPPTINLISPSDGTIVTAPATVTLSALAADTDGTIAKVVFYQGGTKLGEVGNGSYPYTFVWNGVTPGHYSITAEATDNRGATTASAPVLLTVNAPQTSVATPTLTPNGGTFTKPVTVSLTSATPGATIRYAADGTEPTANSPIYSGPFLVSSSCIIKAKAYRSGMMDSASSSAVFVISSVGTSGTEVTFVKSDPVTQGNWKGVYGADGYAVIGDSMRLPSWVALDTAGKADYAWSETNDPRALQRAAGGDRVPACWYSSTEFSIHLSFSDGQTHRLGLYFLDWDHGQRAETVEIVDAADGSVLNTQTLSGFDNGTYLVWDLKGELRIHITRLSGPNAILSGLFFDPPANSSGDAAAAPLLSGAAEGDLKVNGFRLNLSGIPGQPFILETSSNLKDWVPISTNTMSAALVALVDPSAGQRPYQFYRTRCVPQPQFLIEASTDLVHWSAVCVRTSADVSDLERADAATYQERFYRVTLLPSSS